MADEEPMFEAGLQAGGMWKRLAQQIADAIPDIVISGDPEKAILWAACADACYWQATGEMDARSVSDILKARPLISHDAPMADKGE